MLQSLAQAYKDALVKLKANGRDPSKLGLLKDECIAILRLGFGNEQISSNINRDSLRTNVKTFIDKGNSKAHKFWVDTENENL